MKWKPNGREIQNAIDENIAYALSDEEAKVLCAAHNMVVDDLMLRQLVKTNGNGAICKRCNEKTTAHAYYVPSFYEPVCDGCMTPEEISVDAIRKGLYGPDDARIAG